MNNETDEPLEFEKRLPFIGGSMSGKSECVSDGFQTLLRRVSHSSNVMETYRLQRLYYIDKNEHISTVEAMVFTGHQVSLRDDLRKLFRPGPPRWSVSWYEPLEDYRPIQYPPPFPVLAYWKTGETEPITGLYFATLVALVVAETAEQARDALRKAWPTAGRVNDSRWPLPHAWRFFVKESPDYVPASDRFPLPDYTAERLSQTLPNPHTPSGTARAVR